MRFGNLLRLFTDIESTYFLFDDYQTPQKPLYWFYVMKLQELDKREIILKRLQDLK